MIEYFVPNTSRKTLFISLVAIFTALTTLATIVFLVPFPSSQGYFNFGDTFVMLSGFLLGPIGGFIAGGVGSAFGDILLGYPVYVPITLITKGIEGFLVGCFSSLTRGKSRTSGYDVLGLSLGSFAMLIGYLLGEMFLLGYSFEVALLELVTINFFQVSMGIIFTILVGPFLRTYLRDYLSMDGTSDKEHTPDSCEDEALDRLMERLTC